MLFGILTLLSALTISAVAIYYSVAGLVAIFAAAAIPIIIMGVSLEVGKLVTAVWLHKYWKQAAWWLKTYLSVAVFVLMFITSMGIFGFLSKAHIEQTSAGQENIAQVERIESEIQRNEDIIERAESQINKLETSGTGNDANIQAQIDAEQERIDNAYKRIQPAIDEQQAIIDQQAELYEKELAKIDQDMATLQGYIDNGETKKAQQMIGASADGIFGKKTADKIGDWQEEKAKERAELIETIKAARNNPQAQAAADEIKRLRKTVEDQIAQSNSLIDRLRKQLSNEEKAADIDAEVDAQNLRIKNANAEIDKLFEEKFKIEGEYRKLEAEVGPIKYIAEFIYGEQADQNLLEQAVRWVIIIIIFVFDPLAVLLLIASQYTFNWYRENKGGNPPGKPNQDPSPEPEPPYTDEEWNEAHRLNDEFDRAKKIVENVPPTLSKKKTDQYLLWPDVDPEPVETHEFKEEEPYVDPNQMDLNFNQEAEDYEDDRTETRKNTEEGIQASSETQDEEGVQGSNEDDPTVAGTEEAEIGDLDKWNEWVEAANKAAAENPEDDDDEEFWDSLTDEEREAMRLWKAEDEKHSLKYQRKLFRNGQIEEYPWTKYLKPQPDYVDDSKFKIMPELESELKGKPQYTEVIESQEDLKKKKEYLNWMEKDGNQQIKKSKEIDS